MNICRSTQMVENYAASHETPSLKKCLQNAMWTVGNGTFLKRSQHTKLHIKAL